MGTHPFAFMQRCGNRCTAEEAAESYVGIELGADQGTENHKVAKYAASVCDRALLVGSVNRTSLAEGLEEGGMPPERIVCCDTRDLAFQRFNEMAEEGDILLIENDLTDLYEVQGGF